MSTAKATAAEIARLESVRHFGDPGRLLFPAGIEMASKPLEGNGGCGSFYRLTRVEPGCRTEIGYLVDEGTEAVASWSYASSLKAARSLNRVRRAATVARLSGE